MLIQNYGVTYHDKSKSTPGYTLYSRNFSDQVWLINMDGNVVWEYQYESGIGSTWIARAQKYSIEYLMDLTLGDMNSDGELNILDVVILTNIILSQN